MKISGTHYRTIWRTASGSVRVIDQSRLPFEFATVDLAGLDDAARAIKTMIVRGAPLIGATAAYGLALAVRSNPSDAHIDQASRTLASTRPTAHNLAWALTRMRRALAETAPSERAAAAFQEAARICEDDVEQCRAIGSHGLELLRRAAAAISPPPEHPHPLQRRLARVRGLRHGARPHLHGFRRRHPDPRLGG